MELKINDIIEVEIRAEHVVPFGESLSTAKYCPGIRAVAEALGVSLPDVEMGYTVGAVRTDHGAVQSFSIQDYSAFSRMARAYDYRDFDECKQLLPISISLAIKA